MGTRDFSSVPVSGGQGVGVHLRRSSRRTGTVRPAPTPMGALKPRRGGAAAAPKRYPDEPRERAVRMVLEIREQIGQRKGALARVGARFGITPRRCATGSS